MWWRPFASSLRFLDLKQKARECSLFLVSCFHYLMHPIVVSFLEFLDSHVSRWSSKHGQCQRRESCCRSAWSCWAGACSKRGAPRKGCRNWDSAEKTERDFETVQQDQDGARAMAIVRTFSIFSSFPHCCNRYNLSFSTRRVARTSRDKPSALATQWFPALVLGEETEAWWSTPSIPLLFHKDLRRICAHTNMGSRLFI